MSPHPSILKVIKGMRPDNINANYKFRLPILFCHNKRECNMLLPSISINFSLVAFTSLQSLDVDSNKLSLEQDLREAAFRWNISKLVAVRIFNAYASVESFCSKSCTEWGIIDTKSGKGFNTNPWQAIFRHSNTDELFFFSLKILYSPRPFDV